MALCREASKDEIWKYLVQDGLLYGFLKNVGTGLCMDLQGDLLIMATCSGSCSQRWSMSWPIKEAIDTSDSSLFETGLCGTLEPS